MKKLTNITRYFVFTIVFISLSLIYSCNNDTLTSRQLDIVESIIEQKPDSALYILNNIVPDSSDKVVLARYALLKSMALDKNYIDTTTLNVLQPAIDYYLENGSPDNKLRTLYYQGRIYQNAGNVKLAMKSFIRGLDLVNSATDSLTIARMLVAQAFIYKSFYNIDAVTNNYLHASKIYKKKQYGEEYLDCLLNALDGSLLLNKKQKADSILAECESILDKVPNAHSDFLPYKLTYLTKYGSIEQISKFLDSTTLADCNSSNWWLDVSNAYIIVGHPDRAMQILEQVEDVISERDRLKFQATMVSANENLGNYKEAFYEYKNFSKVVDSIHLNLFENKIQFSEDEHKLQLKAKKEADEKRLMIKEFIGIFILLLMALLLLLQAYRSNKSKKELATQKLKSASLENENLRLEREKKVLETENLRHQINDLKTERTNLKNIIKKHDGLSEQVQETIRIRIDMLNALMASQITSNDQFEKSYNVWIKELIADSTNFMNKNRLAFKGSHPQFINYFEDKGLTNDEINYVCLYAIGLRGKEVGAYMNRPSHINLSSTIRKKLGIDKHETNLGIYVRRLLQTL
jgi:hypothetical protein